MEWHNNHLNNSFYCKGIIISQFYDEVDQNILDKFNLVTNIHVTLCA